MQTGDHLLVLFWNFIFLLKQRPRQLGNCALLETSLKLPFLLSQTIFSIEICRNGWKAAGESLIADVIDSKLGYSWGQYIKTLRNTDP